MDESLWGIMNILGPVVLLIALIWLVMRRRSSRTETDRNADSRTEQGTRNLYREEEQRRREGTDKAEE